MRLLNGIETNDRPVLGLDWSRVKGVDLYNPSTDEVEKFPSLEAAAIAQPNSFFVLESTGESYELQRRQTVLDAFEKQGVIAYCFKTQRTAWFRKQFNLAKSNAGDAKVIYRIATETTLALHRFQPLHKSDPIRDEVANFLMQDRYLHNGDQTKVIAKKYLDAATIPMEYNDLLFAGKKPRKQIGRVLAVAEIVRKNNRGYREFRRQMGNYSNGYGCMARSEFYHWWTRMVTNARLGRHVAKALGSLTAEQRLVHRQVLKDATIAARWLWKLTA
jgi:hypothetical protein